jgi:tetratricopeptide (TPR) repeat protein
MAEPVAPPITPLAISGYEISHELARGGMGIVYVARHLSVGREVAIKTLVPGRPYDNDLVRRFYTEVLLTARLQHPAIPPVFTVGRLADGRPYMVMKLVRGQHLSKLLRERPSLAHDLSRFLAVFEQVCQAVGFAHARGVIHRDLKPTNVMVGDFGEVQVMDWGLAKEVPASVRGERDDHTSRDPWNTGVPSAVPPLAKPPSNPDATQNGQPLGTPAYMAPEQARGDWPSVGPRADVFSLGGILTEILTGRPPFVADTPLNALVLAGTAAVGEAFARLDACRADPALSALAKRCLAPDPSHRPADAGVLAEAVALYRTGVEARLQKTEAERAATAMKEREARLRAETEAEAKGAAEERADDAIRRAKVERADTAARRKKGRVLLLLAGAAALLLVGGIAFAWWNDAQSNTRAAERKVREAREEAEQTAVAERDRDAARDALKLAVGLRAQRKYREAADAMARAEKLAAGTDDVLSEVRREKADLAFARELDAVRARKWAWVPNLTGDGGKFDTASVPGAYESVFAAHGFAFARSEPAVLARRISESPIKADLLRALDDWALSLDPREKDTANRIMDVGFRAGAPADLATRLRDPAVRWDPAKTNPLISRADEVAESVPATLFVAGLMERQRSDQAQGLLVLAQAKHPLDFDVAFELAAWHHMRTTGRAPPDRIDFHARQAVSYYRTARALRPDHPTVLINLGHMLNVTGEPAPALAVLRDAVKFHPTDPVAQFTLGVVLLGTNQVSEAETAFRETIKLSPNYANAHNHLCAALSRQKRFPEALVVVREAIRLDPNHAAARLNYGGLLLESGKVKEAVPELRRAVQLAPNVAQAHFQLGVALERTNDAPGAVAAYREAIRLDPKRFADLAKKLPPEN